MGSTLPTWLLEKGPVLLRKHVRTSKYDPLCEEADLIDVNPTYAHVRLKSGREQTVSLRDLAPLPPNVPVSNSKQANDLVRNDNTLDHMTNIPTCKEPAIENLNVDTGNSAESSPVVELRRSTRASKQTDFYQAGMINLGREIY